MDWHSNESLTYQLLTFIIHWNIDMTIYKILLLKCMHKKHTLDYFSSKWIMRLISSRLWSFKAANQKHLWELQMGLLAHQRHYQLESSETFITAFQLLFATISQASLSAVLNPSSVNGRSYFKLPYQRYPIHVGMQTYSKINKSWKTTSKISSLLYLLLLSAKSLIFRGTNVVKSVDCGIWKLKQLIKLYLYKLK